MRIYHLGVVGQDNAKWIRFYYWSTERFEVEALINELLENWHSMGFWVDRPLFKDAEAQEWIAYAEGDRIVRQMMLIREEVDDGN